jgi:hypothetical protein
MTRFKHCLFAAAIIMLAGISLCPRPANALISLETTRPGFGLGLSDQVNWNWIASPGSFFSSGATFGSGGPNYGVGGIMGHVSLAADNGQIRGEHYDWSGNFAVSDYILYTGTGAGPITLTFNNPVSHVGAQIMSASYGAFTGQITAYNGATVLGTYTEIGNSSSAGNNSAIYLGVGDSTAEITKVVYSIISCTLNCERFALNTLSVNKIETAVVDTPEPSTIVLMAAGLIAMAFFNVRRVCTS